MIKAVLALLLLLSGPAWCQTWVEGQHYFLVLPAQPTGLPAGKVQVVEVFSYACPGCNRFYPIIDQLSASLPPNAVMEYLPAGFRPDEDWPLFQRAYIVAEELGVAQKTHAAMFDAVWKTGELAVWDAKLGRAKRPQPAMTDVARFYERSAGIKPETFLANAAAFGADFKVRQANERIVAYGVGETPSLVVNGKYRLNPVTAGGDEETIALVKWLVARESASKSAH